MSQQMSFEQDFLQHYYSYYGLTQRETEILGLLATHGYTNKEIAANCCISEKTVKIHLANIMGKFGISSMRKLLAMLLQRALQVPSIGTSESSRAM